MNLTNFLLIYGFIACSYVVYKVMLYRTDLYFFSIYETFLFFFALITGCFSIIFAFKELNATYNVQRWVISLIFLSVTVSISVKRFLRYKDDKDLVSVIHRAVWAVVVFLILVITLFAQIIKFSGDSW